MDTDKKPDTKLAKPMTWDNVRTKYDSQLVKSQAEEEMQSTNGGIKKFEINTNVYKAFTLQEFSNGVLLSETLKEEFKTFVAHICETLAASTPVKDTPTYNKGIKDDGDVYEDDYGGCKRRVNTEWFTNKKEFIDRLRACTSRTPFVQVSGLLNDIFEEYPPNKAGYWFDVARYYTPRVIN